MVVNLLAGKPGREGATAGELPTDFLRAFMAEDGIDAESIYLLLPETAASIAIETPLPLKEIRVAASGSVLSMGDVFAAFETILERHEDASGLFHCWADAPFMNLEANREILDLHRRYLSEYVFAEGYPAGVSGSLLTRGIIPELKRDGSNIPLRRDGVFETVRVNINAYDIETAVSPRDLRMLRLNLFTDVQRNIQICKSLPLDANTGTEELCQIIEARRPVYRSLPAFFALQLSGKYPQDCPYQLLPPAPADDLAFLDPDNFALMLEKICSFVEDPVISLSLWGELSLHPQLPQILNIAQSHAARNADSPARFLIETSGSAWQPETREQLSTFPPGSLDLILCLDSIDPLLYARLRGSGFNEAMAFADWAQAALADHFYVQALRMQENEEHLMQFYSHWKEKGVRFIIQKYNNYAGHLSQKRVADLSPLKRHECWHVKRDMVVDMSGKVYACPTHSINQKDDLSYGNLLTDDIDKIWAGGEQLLISHLNNLLPEICRSCDEWYTYNF